MAGQLQVTTGPDQGRSFPLSEGETLVIGRGKGTATQLRDPHVSRVHCEVKVEGGKCVLTDAGGARGTLVNGQRITRHELRAGDVIRIGETDLCLVEEARAEEDTMVPPASPKRPPQKAEPLRELVGTKLSQYEVQDVVAKGSSGTVFRAHDTQNNLVVALKVLWPEFSQDDEETARFVRAMKTMLPIRHPNLIALYNAGRTGSYCWMAMEYVEGESLTEVIKRIGTIGMLDWRNALRVAVHIGRALEAAHQHQVLHRNVTPANIMIRAADKVAKLGDLMLAKALEGTLARKITRPGQLLGDVEYISPERTRGTGEVDIRSDIYSLGATVYALLTGRPPFEGDSLADTVELIREAEPIRPKKFQLSIPDQFEGIVLRMLAKRPADRFQTPSELLGDLARVAKYHAVDV